MIVFLWADGLGMAVYAKWLLFALAGCRELSALGLSVCLEWSGGPVRPSLNVSEELGDLASQGLGEDVLFLYHLLVTLQKPALWFVSPGGVRIGTHVPIKIFKT